MKKNMNIDSREWCDMVFENRNKAYGAYALRQTSDKRLIISFGFIIVLAILIAVLPMIVSSIQAATAKRISGIDEKHVISVVDVEQPDEKIIEQPMVEPPKMKIAQTIKLTPPIIVDNPDNDKVMKAVSDLLDSPALVGIVDVPDGSKDKDAIPPSLLDANRQITKDDPIPKIHTVVESMPKFPGGEDEMNRFLQQNLKYPAQDIEQGIHGRVTLRFVVNKDGNISDVTILKGVSPSCDREAIRVVKAMPRWIPGRQNGHAVAVYFNLPIVFRLQ